MSDIEIDEFQDAHSVISSEEIGSCTFSNSMFNDANDDHVDNEIESIDEMASKESINEFVSIALNDDHDNSSKVITTNVENTMLKAKRRWVNPIVRINNQKNVDFHQNISHKTPELSKFSSSALQDDEIAVENLIFAESSRQHASSIRSIEAEKIAVLSSDFLRSNKSDSIDVLETMNTSDLQAERTRLLTRVKTLSTALVDHLEAREILAIQNSEFKDHIAKMLDKIGSKIVTTDKKHRKALSFTNISRK